MIQFRSNKYILTVHEITRMILANLIFFFKLIIGELRLIHLLYKFIFYNYFISKKKQEVKIV